MSTFANANHYYDPVGNDGLGPSHHNIRAVSPPLASSAVWSNVLCRNN